MSFKFKAEDFLLEAGPGIISGQIANRANFLVQDYLESAIKFSEELKEELYAMKVERDEYRVALEKIEHDGKMTIASNSEEFMDGAHDGHLRQAETAIEVLSKYPRKQDEL